MVSLFVITARVVTTAAVQADDNALKVTIIYNCPADFKKLLKSLNVRRQTSRDSGNALGPDAS